jgi:hypothetical protein
LGFFNWRPTPRATGWVWSRWVAPLYQLSSPSSQAWSSAPAQARMAASIAKRRVCISAKSSTKWELPEMPRSGLGQPAKRDIHMLSAQMRWLRVACSEPKKAPQSCRRWSSVSSAAWA